MSKGLQISLAALSVFVGVGAWLAAGGSGEGTFEYYSSVSDFQLASTPLESSAQARMYRVHGFVVAGSIAKDLPAGHVDFAIRDDAGSTLAVRYRGLDVPDLFADGAEVVVEGRNGAGHFVADRVLAKCPSKYETVPGAPGASPPSPETAAPQV